MKGLSQFINEAKNTVDGIKAGDKLYCIFIDSWINKKGSDKTIHEITVKDVVTNAWGNGELKIDFNDNKLGIEDYICYPISSKNDYLQVKGNGDKSYLVSFSEENLKEILNSRVDHEIEILVNDNKKYQEQIEELKEEISGLLKSIENNQKQINDYIQDKIL